MEYETLLDFYNDLKAVVEEGDEQKTQAMLAERFAQLPEDMQGELLMRLYFSAIDEEAKQANAIADFQTKGLDALDALDALKQQIEGGSGGTRA